MREDIHNKLKEFTREELCLLNKSELARRFNCDPRTVERYLKLIFFLWFLAILEQNMLC